MTHKEVSFMLSSHGIRNELTAPSMSLSNVRRIDGINFTLPVALTGQLSNDIARS